VSRARRERDVRAAGSRVFNGKGCLPLLEPDEFLRVARMSGANRVTYLSDHANSGAITPSGMRGVRFSPR